MYAYMPCGGLGLTKQMVCEHGLYERLDLSTRWGWARKLLLLYEGPELGKLRLFLPCKHASSCPLCLVSPGCRAKSMRCISLPVPFTVALPLLLPSFLSCINNTDEYVRHVTAADLRVGKSGVRKAFD